MGVGFMGLEVKGKVQAGDLNSRVIGIEKVPDTMGMEENTRK